MLTDWVLDDNGWGIILESDEKEKENILQSENM